MSIVITVMQHKKIIMAEDTQLNIENGPIVEIGMKIFPMEDLWQRHTRHMQMK